MADLLKFVRHLLKYEAGISEDFEYPEKESKELKPLFLGYSSLVEQYVYGTPSRESVRRTHELINYSIKKGMSYHKDDPGGFTICGITNKTWDKACIEGCFNGMANNVFEKMTSVHWLTIVRRYYWDVWQADDIISQDLAEHIVDFYFHSGNSATKIIQKLLHVYPDGIIGPKTIKALLYADARILCSQIKRERLNYLLSLSHKGHNSAFALGWLRRLVDW